MYEISFNKDYYEQRMKQPAIIYRLERKTKVVEKIIKEYFRNYSNLNCLDIGTADGIMLSRLHSLFRFNKAIGIDSSAELIGLNKDPHINLEVGDAENLKFINNSFNIIIACSIIQYVNPSKMFFECYRVLRKDGILIVTFPNPLYYTISLRLGYIKERHYLKILKTKDIMRLLIENNFNLIHLEYFIFCPFFNFFLEDYIESFLKFIKLEKLMINLVIVGKKIEI